MSALTSEIKRRIGESGVPLRELGSLSGVNYQKICDWKKGWTELSDPELASLETALTEAIRSRAEKFNTMLAISTSAPGRNR